MHMFCNAASCVTEATAFQTACSGYIQALIQATGGQIVASTDDQISTLVAGLESKGQTPTSTCCTAAQGLISDVDFTPMPLTSHLNVDTFIKYVLAAGAKPLTVYVGRLTTPATVGLVFVHMSKIQNASLTPGYFLKPTTDSTTLNCRHVFATHLFKL